MTMWQAVREARAQGVVTASRGRPISLAAAADASLALPPSPPARPWERVAASLRRDILAGSPMPGEPMTSAKDVMRTHGVCHHTVRRAIMSLVHEGLLQPHGRWTRVTDAPPSRRARSDVVLIAFGADGRIPLVTPRTHEHVRILEQKCSRMNVRLCIVTADQIFAVPNGKRALLAELRTVRPLGVILWREVYMVQPFRDLADLVASTGLPFVVLDESGDAHELLPRRKALPCRVFAMGVSPLAGRDIGYFLARHGHRHIAYVASSASLLTFSAARLQGLRRATAEAGFPEAVRLFVADGSDAMGSPPRYPGASAVVDRVLTHQEISALVAENDPLALECLACLQKRGIGVPGRLSVVGFDDGMAAMLQRMTSYNFGGDNVTAAMLAFLLDPGRYRRGRGSQVPVELPGRVVERQSTGPARSARA
jgi:DNA-binding LacI/PurR family transcriptional regulator